MITETISNLIDATTKIVDAKSEHVTGSAFDQLNIK